MKDREGTAFTSRDNDWQQRWCTFSQPSSLMRTEVERIKLKEKSRRQGGETERDVLYVKTISAIKITAVGRLR